MVNSSFPWDKVKAETLRTLGRDLGVSGSFKREEIIETFVNIEKHGRTSNVLPLRPC